jgi:hypothetical protein
MLPRIRENDGHIIDDGSPGPTIITSDVDEWAPAGIFLLQRGQTSVC